MKNSQYQYHLGCNLSTVNRWSDWRDVENCGASKRFNQAPLRASRQPSTMHAPRIASHCEKPPRANEQTMTSTHRSASMGPAREKTYFEQQREALLSDIGMVSCCLSTPPRAHCALLLLRYANSVVVWFQSFEQVLANINKLNRSLESIIAVCIQKPFALGTILQKEWYSFLCFFIILCVEATRADAGWTDLFFVSLGW